MLQRIAAVVALCVLASGLIAGDKPLTNEDVVAMVKAGLDPSTVIAKIGQSGTGAFDTSVDALIKLKKAGVPKDVIDAMIGGASTISGATASRVPQADVQLLTSGGVIDLESLQGDPSATYIGVGFLTWLNFDGARAQIRTSDGSVSLRVRSEQKPDSRLFVVRLDSNKSDRSVKMGRSRMFTASAPTTPDRDWTFAFDAKEEGAGVWKLTLREPLPKGEYGILRGTELFDFGID